MNHCVRVVSMCVCMFVRMYTEAKNPSGCLPLPFSTVFLRQGLSLTQELTNWLG